MPTAPFHPGFGAVPTAPAHPGFGAVPTAPAHPGFGAVPTALFTVLLTALFTVLFVAGPVGPGGQAGAQVADSIRIVSQSTYVAADGVFEAEIEIDVGAGDTSDLELSVTVFGLAEKRADLLSDRPGAEPLNRLPSLPVDRLPTLGPGRHRLEVPLRSGPRFDRLDRALLPFAGVYPIRVELRSADGLVATTHTHFVRLPAPGEPAEGRGTSPPVAVVVPIGAEGIELGAAVELIASHPEMALTAVVDEGGLETIRGNRVTAGALATALAGRPLVAAPTLDLDPSALAEVAHGHLFEQTRRGLHTELANLGFTVPEGVAVLDAPLTDEGRQVLGTAGIDLVLAPSADADRRVAAPGPQGPISIVGMGADPALDLADDGAALVLARLALEGEGTDTRSRNEPGPVMLGTGGGWAQDDRGVDGAAVAQLDLLLTALAETGAPSVVPLPQLRVDPSGSDPRGPAVEQPQQDLGPVAELLAETENRLATYEQFHADGGTDPSHYRHVVLDSLDRERSAGDRRASLTTVRDQLDKDLAVIDIPTGQPLTMAARTATIPVVVENEAEGPRTVMLRFRSDKVSAAADGRLVTIEPGTSSIDVEIEARSLGASPLRVSVMTPDGNTLLATSQFEIRSTAVPGLGLLTSAGALAFLALWWLLDARKRRLQSV